MKWTFFIALIVSALGFSQNTTSQLEFVDFKKASAAIQLDAFSNEVSGEVIFELDVLKNTNSVFLDAKNLVNYKATINGKEVKTIYDGEKLVVESRFRESETKKIKISFTSFPSKAMYHIDEDNDRKWEQVWTQGQGKYTSNWLPSIDDMNDKMVWDFKITAPQNKTVIANGSLKDVAASSDFKTWTYDMKKPMSSYLVAIVAGDYEVKRDSSNGGTPLEFYYYTGQEDKVASTYKYSKQIFNFLESEIGVAYPWQNYKQIPVKDFLYSGMENTGTTIFNDQFFADSLGANDRSYVNVNAHELAHQWFGNLVTETDSKHHWLHEGFASYYALLAERNIYGDFYFQKQLFDYAEALHEQSSNGKSTALLDPKANSLTFYQHGAWALHALKDEVGTDNLRASIKEYLKSNQYKNVTTEDFLDAVERISMVDLSNFKTFWLTSTTFPTAEALRILRKDAQMEKYLQLSARRISSFDESYNSYKETLQDPIEVEMVKEMVAQLSIHDDPRKYDLIKKALALNNLEINQLFVLSTQELNDQNRELVTNLINDPSYVTRESALFLLWNDAKDKRALLEKARASWEEINPSLDMSWIVLALNSSGYSNEELKPLLIRLQSYSSTKYSTEIRTAAFDYLINLNAMSQQNYKDLMEASLHHVWRFYENARDILKAQYKKENGKFFINQSMDSFDTINQEKLKKILGIN
ncbi:aminopeptidase N [Nonlabens dokdonensis]|uniref:Aminopeptidase N n=2 Tax=Nonlabens dokdonensis TaxID=328515 RepID=L7W6I9_NONDD|nr:M1 family metallopeptidase [Nonlabens dokdonensis]AGC75396.1 peptidase family M1 aminopeptidase [Nonlabens dokdonensis DSW-6]PZX43095.1 aminopeptidase N [Nonlabens dokdonensis]